MREVGQLAALIAASLRAARVPLSDEKDAQAAISTVLAANKIDHAREHRLGLRDIPDFYCPPDLIIEVKMHGARAAEVYRQLARYAQYDEVGAVMLVTNRAMGLPQTIGGKPAYFVSLGRGWL